jgi:hypothetical protein
VNVASFLLKKFLTILAPLAFVLFMTWGLLGYLADGPTWFTLDDLWDECNDYWWANLTFLNNFVPNLKLSKCLSYTYYITLEMQFFFLTIPFLYFYARFSRFFGWVSMIGLICVNLAMGTYIAYYHDLNAVIADG